MAYTPLITGENITRVTVDKESETSNYYAVNLTLDSAGTEAFAQATRELAPTNGKIVIILDGQIQSAPAVQSEITGGQVAITGGYSLEEAQSLQTVLESGSLPVSFHYEQSQVVGPTLGQDALMSGLLVAILDARYSVFDLLLSWPWSFDGSRYGSLRNFLLRIAGNAFSFRAVLTFFGWYCRYRFDNWYGGRLVHSGFGALP